MTKLSSRRLARILAPLAIITALTGTAVAVAGEASAANTICSLSNDSGFSDPTCGPFSFSSSSGGGSAVLICELTAAAHSEWGAPVWSGTFYEDTRANVCRSGANAAAPYMQVSTTVYSSSVFGFHGCAEAFAYDAAHNVVVDMGMQRLGVDGGNSYTWTGRMNLGSDRAKSIASLGIVQKQC